MLSKVLLSQHIPVFKHSEGQLFVHPATTGAHSIHRPITAQSRPASADAAAPCDTIATHHLVRITAPPVTRITFEDKVLLEQIRYIESQQALDDSSVSVLPGTSTGQPFEVRLLTRAQRLTREKELGDHLHNAAGIFSIAKIIALLLSALLGAAATLTALSVGNTINIYWLLLLLVGFNLLSMILWIAGVSMKMENLTRGLLTKATVWLPTLMSSKSTTRNKANEAWFDWHFSGQVGKWRASQITQQLWLVYLSAGLASLMLALVARQFDFVWGTTLLSDASFIRLTDTLSEPLQLFGFTTPTTQQVVETRTGTVSPLTAAQTAMHRYNWAQFLLGTLLFYGLLPRVLLWIVSTVWLQTARAKSELDYYLPYYVHLRETLIPLHGESQIVDADARTTRAQHISNDVAAENQEATSVPVAAYWVAVELGAETLWPAQEIDTDKLLGEVVDRSSLDAIMTKLQDKKVDALAIVVSAGRAPDRGLKRSIASLQACATNTWLVLLQPSTENNVANTRLNAWYSLAKDCQIPAENLIMKPGPAL